MLLRWVVGVSVSLGLAALLFAIGVRGLERQYEQPAIPAVPVADRSLASVESAEYPLPRDPRRGAGVGVPLAGAGRASVRLTLSAGKPFEGASPLTASMNVPRVGTVAAADWEVCVYPPGPLELTTLRSSASIAYRPQRMAVTPAQLRDINAARGGKLRVRLAGSGTLSVYKARLHLTCRAPR